MNATARDALIVWFGGITGLTTIWADQNAPRPDYPYGVLNVTATRKVGTDEVTYTFDGGQPAGQQMVPTFHGYRIHTVSCWALTLGQEAPSDAQSLLDNAVISLRYPSYATALNAAGVSFSEVLGWNSIDEEVRGRWLAKRSADIAFSVFDSRTITAQGQQYISVAEITSDLSGINNPNTNFTDDFGDI
jgi:hypothetical protein